MSFTANAIYAGVLFSIALDLAGCGAGRVYDTPAPGGKTFIEEVEPNPTLPKAAFQAAVSPVGMVPSIAILNGPSVDAEGGGIQYVEFSVNGFPARGFDCIDAHSGPQSISGIIDLCPVHPYFLIHGKNQLHVAKPGFTVAVENWDYLESKSHTRIASLGPAQDGQFPFAGDVPEWPWVKGSTIVEAQESLDLLKAEVQKFHRSLETLTEGGPDEATHRREFLASVQKSIAAFIRASELRGKPYHFLEQMVAAAEGLAMGQRPPKSVELKPLLPDLTMDIFAGGKLARLKAQQDYPTINFDSTFNDGPWGAKGKNVIACDLWYRQESGQWVLDAVVPRRSLQIASGYEVGEINTENLARLFQAQSF